MKNKRLNRLKSKKYLAGVLLILIVGVLAYLLKFGKLDKLEGTIKINNAYLSNVTTKLSANISDISGEAPVVSNGYDEVNYELKFTLSESNQDRDVIISGSLDSDNGYASFKHLTGDNITSTLSDNDRKIEIVIRNLPANTEITAIIPILVNGAPNGYRVNPTFKIKESTADSYTDVYTNPIEVNTNNLRGAVTNTKGERVSDILVSIYKGRRLIRETYTNSDGEYIFSDLNEDSYTVDINEEIYKVVNFSDVSVSGDTVLNINVERVYPFNIEVHKYITKVDVNNLGTKITKTYNNASIVNFPVKRLTNLNGKVYYKIIVENTGEKEGIVSIVKDELPDFMAFNEEENNGFELVDGVIYDRNLEGIELYPGQKVEDTLVLTIKNTSQAREYLNRVTATGEIYEHVVYLLDGNTYREEDVLEGEKLDRIADPIANFSGWYTDSEYTNKYNYNNRVTKNLILYGKTTRKYKVEFFDKDPETGDEDPYHDEEVPAGDPVPEPDDHPDHTGYDFEYWCMVDGTKYIFSTPVNEDLKLVTCYKIKKYDVNFYDYLDTLEKNIKVEYKKLIDQNEAPTFDETGYTFICWSEDKTNCFDFTTPVTRNIDLYPIHQILTNAVVFNDENRITTINNIPYGDTVDPIADQGKEGHTFRCWSENHTDCFDFNTPIIENKTLWAIYDINKYLVHFIDRNPETLVETTYAPDQLVEWGSTATRPTPDPEHTGYTFTEWTKDNTSYSFDTPVKSEITLVTNYNINSYPVHFHDGNDTTTVNVLYKHTVDPIADPTKEHHLFIEWVKEDDTPFDFTTLIVEETDLYSTYEEILPPKIDHTPIMWTNENVTATLYPNANLLDNTGYSYLYKIGSDNYNTYYQPFEVEENTTITAKASKQNVDSTVVNHQIVNIDKLNPTITLFSLNSANKSTVTLNVNSSDNESGINYYEIYQDNVKVGEKRFECYNETTFERYEACRNNYPTERVSTYMVTGLAPSTTYTFKIKAFDKAGNYVFSDELEATTTTPRIVARLIGYNNQLFEDTIDPDTNQVTVPKEDKYINFESLAEAFDYEDLYDCKNVQCTIQMVTGTDESVQVLEGQDLTLDLNGKIVAGVIPEYTIKNNGSFTLIESTPEGEEPGKLVNSTGIALLNKAGCHMTLGEGYSDVKVNGSIVSTTKPYVYGETNGIKSETNGYLTIFDGRIVSPNSSIVGSGAVNGKVTGTEYSYEAVSNIETISGTNYQVVTLNRLTAPEARINNSVYYAKLGSAMDDANRGNTTIYTDNEPKSIMSDVQSVGTYKFVYDNNTDTLVSYSGNRYAQRTNSHVIIDLTNETNNKVLSIDYTPEIVNGDNQTISFINGQDTSSGPVYGENYYIFDVHEIDDYTKNILGDHVAPYRHDSENYSFELEKGKMYYLDLQYFKNRNSEYSTYLGEATINDITLSDLDKVSNNVELQTEISTKEYGFYYDSTDGTIRSNNQYVAETSVAYGVIEIDLTGLEGYYYVNVNYTMESYYEDNSSTVALSYAQMYVGEDKRPSSGNWLGEFYGSNRDIIRDMGDSNIRAGYATYGPRNGNTSLEGGKKYYLKIQYQKMVKNPDTYPTRQEFESVGCQDQLIINSIDVYKRGDSSNLLNYNKDETSNNIMTDLLNNSSGDYVLKSDGKTITTNNTQANQSTYTYATIDLTNDPQGETVLVNYNNTKAYTNGYYSGYIYLETSGSTLGDMVHDEFYYNSTSDRNYLGIFQKREKDGKEYLIAIESGQYNNDCYSEYCEGYLYYNLPGGYEYELRVKAKSPDNNTYERYPNIEITDIKTYKATDFEGNYINGVFNYRYAANTNAFNPLDSYKDSYIKIDLTNYDKDQVLYLDGSTGDYSKNRFYLTNNNRALSQEELNNNRAKTLETSNSSFNVVLEKGKIYYLHIASGGGYDYEEYSSPYYHYRYNYMSYYEWGYSLYNIRLNPIDDQFMAIGGPTIFTGTVDVANTREEESYVVKRNASEPVFANTNTLYGFEYDDETDTYNSLNAENGDIAVKVFKIDLTESTSDKTYSLIYNGGSRNVYTVGDSENIPIIDLSAYRVIYDDWKYTLPSNYYKFEDRPTFTLEKGKVHYLQVVTYNNNGSTLSLKVEEMNTSNTTSEYHPVKEIREFNENVDTVQLLRSVSTTKALEVDYSEEVILDLNGYDLSTGDDYVIKNYGNLTLVDTKYQRKLETYDDDLAEYQEYAGLCDGCTVSEEYKLDHLMDYLDEFGINLDNPDPTSVVDFNYTGAAQEYVVPQTGIYRLQVWGAEGGYRINAVYGGNGGYSEGLVELKEGETIYIYVGGSGNTGGPEGGFNGGGARQVYNGGGGATDIRVEGNSPFNRIIVAGGGGSDGSGYQAGGAGGGATGSSADTSGFGTGGDGGTQTAPGTNASFGIGADGVDQAGGYGGAGGGGWFGGGNTTPDSSGDDDNGGGGGSGFVYLPTGTQPVSGYLVENHFLLSGSTTSGTLSIPTHDGTGTMYGNEGDGFAKISLIVGDEIEQLRENLPKTYNVKTEPSLEGMSELSNGSGTGVIHNMNNSTLTLRDVKVKVTSKYGIYNEGTIIAESSPIINVDKSKSIGIYNLDGDIVNNGNLKIKLNTTSCTTEGSFDTIGVQYNLGSHDLNNIDIEGKIGIGVYVEPNTELRIHSSNIDVNERLGYYSCDYMNYDNRPDTTNKVNSSLYDKSYSISVKSISYKYSYYSNTEYYNRFSGSIFNEGTVKTDDGTVLAGLFNNYGDAYLYNGVTFDSIYQNDSYVAYQQSKLYNRENPTLSIYNTVVTPNQIVNYSGTLNVVEEENNTSSITGNTTSPVILNFDKANITGGSISNIYNMGTLNSNGASYGKLYNLHTVVSQYSCAEYYNHMGECQKLDKYFNPDIHAGKDLKGTANITGGSINNEMLLNEHNMVLDGVTVPTSVMNRGNLTVKGDSVITGNNKSAIQNIPFLLKYYYYNLYAWETNQPGAYNYARTSLTIGDDDGNVNEGPTIISTNDSYAISGDCHPMGTVGMDDFELKGNGITSYFEPEIDNNRIYKDTSGNLVTIYQDGNDLRTTLIKSIEYPNNSDNLCDIKYYDGTIQNTSTSSNMTNVVYIPISDLTDGYDVLYDGNGKVTLDTIDSSSRGNLVEVNGTGYKSLQTAINNAADNSVINISGNYNTANRVTIPEGKSLTINYANGASVNSYSRDSLITNNGTLNVTGSGSIYVIGQTAFENNNAMTFNGGNFINNYTQSNLVKNKANLTIDNVTSTGLDIISDTDGEEKINLTINNGEYNANTIYANNTNVTVGGGYFYTKEDNSSYEAYYADSTTELEAKHTKQLFNTHNSVVDITNFNVDNDSRYNNISIEANLGRFVDSTLNLNNSKFGGKSSKSRIYTTIDQDQSKSIVNINDGEYNNLRFNIVGNGNEYNQTDGIVNGSLLATGSGHTINITGGKINTSDTAILVKDGSGINVTVGTKGDLKPGTETLNVSKTEPEIRGGTFGISETGSSYAQNNLYFYDGVFKAGSNPIDYHIEDIETGYDVIFDNLKSPKEKYLDILPLVLNYTTGKYYYDAQEAFDEANTDDQLIWTRDYTNFSDTPSLVVAADKKFSLYFSYGTADYKPIYYRYYESDNPPTDPLTTTSQDEFEPYDGSGSFVHSNMTARQNNIKINNTAYYDSNSGETIERPFLINNGNITIYGAVVPNSGTDPILDVMSKTSAIVNNGTMTLNRFSVRNIKANKTMVENNGTMDIYRSDFISYQSNVITNNGTLSITGDATSTSCYNPTYIKVHTDQSLEDAIEYIQSSPGMNIHQALSESIINNENAIMNISNLYFDSDYTYTALLNSGTVNISNSTIETYKLDSYNNLEKAAVAGKVIINNVTGTINASTLSVFAESGIENTGTMVFNQGVIDAAYDTAITNTGDLTYTGAIFGARKGIDDAGKTTLINANIYTYGEGYHGTGYLDSTITASTITSKGYNPTNYYVGYSAINSCSDGTSTRQEFKGYPHYESKKEFEHGYFAINNASVYIGPNKTVYFDSNTISLDNEMPTKHFCDYTYDNGYRYYHCEAPYQHSGQSGLDYTVAAIEIDGGNFVMSGGSVNHGTDSDYKYAIILYQSYSNHVKGSVTQTGGYISKLFNEVGTITMGEKDDTAESSMYISSASCKNRDDLEFNLYGGSLFLDENNLCHFTDKEENFTIYRPNGGPYMLINTEEVIKNIDQDVSYSSIRTAISNAADGEKLQLVKTVSEVTSNYDITVDKGIILDLNGKTLDANLNITSGTVTVTDEAYIADNTNDRGRVLSVTNTSGTLNVVEGRIDKINNFGTANISNGIVESVANSDWDNPSNAILNVTGGEVKNIVNEEDGTANISNTTGSYYKNYHHHSSGNDGVMNITNSTISTLENSSMSLSLGTGAYIKNLSTSAGNSNNDLTLTGGTVEKIINGEKLVLDGTEVLYYVENHDTLTINSGTVNGINNVYNSNVTINGGVIRYLNLDSDRGTEATINNGTIGSITITNYHGAATILGGEIGPITNKGQLTIGTKDGIVNTNSPKITNNGGYAITSSGYDSFVKIYDGYFKSTKSIVIDATIDDVETGFIPYASPEYDELGVLTGKHIMYLKHAEEVDTKIACVQGICYNTLQEAINASVQNYTEQNGCPEVKIGDEFYFSVELTEDLVLDPQYSLTINLNYHNINDNGFTIPDNITLRNGSRNGEDLQSNISKLLSSIFGINDNGKDIIITRMEDGNALDTSKTYNLYKYEGSSYELVKVNPDGAGKYTIGRKTTDLKPIKGRIYLNDLDAGEYKLVDNYNTELQFTIYDDGTLSPNIKENIISDFGHMSASSVATLVITIQTGIMKVNYLLIAISIIAVLSIMFVLKRKSDVSNQ
ncbi:MAG: InlB B-repeat-containing protein [Bacilli bacterium]|nr:InlB B-repeat-containing protein [Bacilli bacterium]